MGRAASTVAEHLPALDIRSWAEEHTRLFECTVPCPINEPGFVRRDKGAILGDIAGFYRTFGFRLAPSAHERVDHLVAELEFCALLLVMLATARRESDHGAARIARDALGSFASDHIGQWLPAFCARLKEETTLSFYRQLAALLGELWTGLSRYHQLPAPVELPTRAAFGDSGAPYECGMAESRWTCAPAGAPEETV